MRIARRFVISGRVQGVGFRWFTKDVAAREGVTGWVRNLPDGRVEAVFEGPAEDVHRLVDWAGHGPRLAAVATVEVHAERPEGLGSFTIG